MSTQPEYIKQQIDQKVRDRQASIKLAIETLEEAKANFKIEIETINRCYDAYDDPNFVPTQKARTFNTNQITADPSVAQYA